MKSLSFFFCFSMGSTLAAAQSVPQSVLPADSNSQIGTSTTPNPAAVSSTSATLSHPSRATGNSFFDAMGHRGFAGMLLDHRAELQLAGKQISALGELEQLFRTQTDSATRQIDSLRKANGGMTKGLSLRKVSSNPMQLGALLQSQQTMATLAQRVLTVQQQIKQRSLLLLTPAQRAQATVLEKQMRQVLSTTLHSKAQGTQSQGTSSTSLPLPTQSAH